MSYVVTQIITACWIAVAKSPTNYPSKVKRTWRMLLMLAPIVNGDISQVSISMQSTNIIYFLPWQNNEPCFQTTKGFSKLQIIQKKNYLRFLIFLIWCSTAVSRPTIRPSEKNKIQNAKILRGFIHESANIWGKKNTEDEILHVVKSKHNFLSKVRSK